MRFLNPKTDFAFKKIFGSEESRDILLSFLNAILALPEPHRIIEVSILDPYQVPKIKGMKDTYLDLKVKDQEGKTYIIEMQVLNVEGFEKRVLYNACKSYANQLGKGDRYHLLTEVIAVTITSFTMFETLDEIITEFKFRANHQTDLIYNDDLHLVFVELSKFEKEENSLTNTLDKWLYFLKKADDLTAIPQTMKMEPAIVHAFEIADKANLTQEELDDQERREIFIQDQRGALSLAQKKGLQAGIKEGKIEGIKEGIKEGKIEGIKEGIKEGKIAMAKSLKKQGVEPRIIAEASGLTIKEIDAL